MKRNDLREALANIKRIQAHEDTVTAFRAHDATIKKYEAALERLDRKAFSNEGLGTWGRAASFFSRAGMFMSTPIN